MSLRLGEEIQEVLRRGERELSAKAAPASPSKGAAPRVDRKERGQKQRETRKELAALERNIAKLDERRRELSEQLLKSTDPAEALRLHTEITAIASELKPIEERWCELQELAEAEEV